MASNLNQSIKLLYILDILKHNTDEDHPMDSSDIIDILESKGIKCERKSIYANINSLIEYGYDIIKTRSPKRGFFLGSQDFEFPEVRLLMDAVLSASFITPKKTELLLSKLKGLVNTYAWDTIVNQIYVDPTTKTTNEQIYYNIDIINKAISSKKQISFSYTKRSIHRGKITSTEKEHTISPYALIWSNQQYYLVGNYSKYDNLSHYRLDRITGASVLDTPIRNFSEVSPYTDTFDTGDYCKKVFNMYGGKEDIISLIFKEDIFEQIIEKFGTDAKISPTVKGEYHLTAPVIISEGLIDCLIQLGDSVRILSPESLRNEIIKKVTNILKQYE